uniref:Uncharacterized protein n=1 Tax=Peronospora matthiolae TaxID=2874970 RepID=A0AAV1SZZ6_9STRA
MIDVSTQVPLLPLKSPVQASQDLTCSLKFKYTKSDFWYKVMDTRCLRQNHRKQICSVLLIRTFLSMVATSGCFTKLIKDQVELNERHYKDPSHCELQAFLSHYLLHKCTLYPWFDRLETTP